MKLRVDRPSGASGELSPLLYARTNELAKAAAADALLENMTPLPEGARTRTPGTRFICPLADETKPARLLPFEAAIGDTYMLSLNGGVMQVFRDGARVGTSTGETYEVEHPFRHDQLDGLFTAQIRGTLFIASGGKPQILTRNSDIDWTIAPYETVEAPVRIQNTDQAKTIGASGVTGTVTLTANFPCFLVGHIGSVWRMDEKDFSDIPAWKAIETVALNDLRRNKGRIYQVIALNGGTDTGPNPPTHDEGDVFSSGGNVTWRFISNSGGYVRIDAVASATSATATVLQRLPDQVTTKPTYRWFEAAWSDVRGWPTVVSVVDQSLVWARENEVWISKATDIYSFDLIDEEDSAIAIAINAPDGKLVQIGWILPAGVLVIGTRSNEWVVRGQSTYERLTATNARAVPQGSRGSLIGHQPAMINGGAAYIGRNGRRLHFARFDAVTEQVEFQEFTTFSRHMLKAGARQLAFTADPHPVLWVRLDDGTLRGLTLMPEQEIVAWHRRPMINGKVLQIAAIQAADESRSELWLVVERLINGETRRFIEQMQPYFEADDPKEPTAAGAWFLDCARATALNTGPYSSVSGLEHLEGQTVGVFANGVMLAERIVADGRITLPRPMRNILVGLPLHWKIKTLPWETNTNKGTSKSLMKSCSRTTVHVHESAGGMLSANGGPEQDIFLTAGTAPAQPMPLTSGTLAITIEPITDMELVITLQGTDALPFTLLGLTPEIDLKDT
ncbi:MAG: hypothetical protein ACRDBL_03790 [Rhabdaerophilum sp.]